MAWGGGKANKDGVITMPWPDYDPRVWKALVTAYQVIGPDYSYLDHHPAIASVAACALTPEQLSTRLTWMIRGERFSDGYVDKLIQNGQLLEALQAAIICAERA